MPDLIIFNCIAVNNQTTNAGILIGDNAATGWDANSKTTGSFSTLAGAGNIITANLTLITDNDVIDTPIMDNDIEGGPIAQA